MSSAVAASLLGLRLHALLSDETPLWARITIVSVAVVATYALAQVAVGRVTRGVAARDETDPAS